MKKLLRLLIFVSFTSLSQIQIGIDINGETVEDQLGYSVSSSFDGSIIAIGAPHNNGNIVTSGYVRIYENQSNNWVQIGNDIDGEAYGDLSGQSVSLSSDGSIVAIGARLNDGNGEASGHVRVYENQFNNWVKVGDDIDGEAAGDNSGWSVSLSSSGSVVAIGAFGNDGNGEASGHVRVYENQFNNWVQIGNDIDGEAVIDRSGLSVSLSSDGSIVAIGADNNNDNLSGHVRIYENQSNNWVQIGDDIDGEAAGDLSGQSVSLSSDGTIVAIGAYVNSDNGFASGYVRIYENKSNNWVQIGNDIDGEFTIDQSGYSVDLSSDGSIVIIGAPFNNENGTFSGQVRVYDLSTLLSSEEFVVSNFQLYPNPTKNQFTIQLENSTELENVNIYNNLGQQVLTSKETVINTSKLASGLYVVELETTKGKGSKKLIIE